MTDSPTAFDDKFPVFAALQPAASGRRLEAVVDLIPEAWRIRAGGDSGVLLECARTHLGSIADTALGHGVIAVALGHTEEGVRRLLCAAECFEDGGNSWAAADSLVRAARAAGLDEAHPPGRALGMLERAAAVTTATHPQLAVRLWRLLAERDPSAAPRALMHEFWCVPEVAGRETHLAAAAALEASDDTGWALRARGVLAAMCGDHETAMSVDLDVLRIARQRGDRVLEATASEGLALARSYTSDDPDIAATLRSAIPLSARRRGALWEVKIRVTVGEILLEQRDANGAREEFQDAEQSAHRAGLDGWAAHVCSHMAMLDVRVGDVATAVRRADEAARAAHAPPQDVRDAFIVLLGAQVGIEADRLAASAQALTDVENSSSFRSLSDEVADTRLRIALLEDDRSSTRRMLAEASGTDAAREHYTAIEQTLWLVRRLVALGWHDEVELAARNAQWARTAISDDTTRAAKRELAALVLVSANEAGGVAHGDPALDLDDIAGVWSRQGFEGDATWCRAAAAAARANRGDVATAVAEMRRVRAALDAGGWVSAARIVTALADRVIPAHAGRVRHGQVPWMTQLDAVVRSALVAKAEVCTLEPGAEMVTSGKAPEMVYLVSAGVAMAARLTAGEDLPVDVLGAGACPGAEAALADHLLTAIESITALTQVTALRIDAGAMRQLAAEHPALGRRLHAELSGVAERRNRLRDTHFTVDERVEATIRDLAQRVGSRSLDGLQRLPKGIPQRALAGMAGCSRKAVVAALAELRHAGVIRMEGRQICVLPGPSGSIEPRLN